MGELLKIYRVANRDSLYMQQKHKALLFQILATIKYSKDKGKFIKEFEITNHFEALGNILEKLPEQVREILRGKLTKGKGEEIKNYISFEEYSHELNRTADEAIIKLVDAISPILTLDQKEKIAKLVKS